MLKIRRINQSEKQLKTWQQQYQLQRVSSGSTTGKRYFQLSLVSQTQKTEALISVDSWCSHCWPTLAHYAWEALDVGQLCALFTAETNEKTFFDNRFRCESIDVISANEKHLFILQVKENRLGEVLLTKPIEGFSPSTQSNNLLENFKLQADWVLGHSYISAKLLSSLELRDVFYIQQLQLQMSIGGHVFAQFQKQEEGLFMIEELIVPEEQ